MRNALSFQICNEWSQLFELFLRNMDSFIYLFLKRIPSSLNLRDVVHDEFRFEVGMLPIYEAKLAISLLRVSCWAPLVETDVGYLLVAFAVALGSVLLPVGCLCVNRSAVVDHLPKYFNLKL